MIGLLLAVIIGVTIIIVLSRMMKSLQQKYNFNYEKVKILNHELEIIKALSYLLQNQNNLNEDIKQIIYIIMTHSQFSGCTLICRYQEKPDPVIFRYIKSDQNPLTTEIETVSANILSVHDLNVTEDSQLSPAENTIIAQISEKKEIIYINKSDIVPANTVSIPLSVNGQNNSYLFCTLPDVYRLTDCQKHSLQIIGNITSLLIYRYSIFNQIPTSEQMNAVHTVW